ncbi:hypothetical protein LWI29_015039 [Acer saccharum]|uniref:Uncharacterized protein n=1 Tax=Acer saccharum TaxID=4024 RepID=A0AA39W6C1_ACESA|nr:hypothetical protein LWI29_015039 [Acer saccharum]
MAPPNQNLERRRAASTATRPGGGATTPCSDDTEVERRRLEVERRPNVHVKSQQEEYNNGQRRDQSHGRARGRGRNRGGGGRSNNSMLICQAKSKIKLKIKGEKSEFPKDANRLSLSTVRGRRSIPKDLVVVAFVGVPTGHKGSSSSCKAPISSPVLPTGLNDSLADIPIFVELNQHPTYGSVVNTRNMTTRATKNGIVKPKVYAIDTKNDIVPTNVSEALQFQYAS